MLIALLGDTHLPRGTRRIPDACLRVLAEAELIVHVGDFVAMDVLAELRELGPVAAVHGNMDAPDVRAALPQRSVVEADELRLGLVHDPGPREGRYQRLRGWFPECAVIVYGHTHWPEAMLDEGVWIVNPGSPTERRRAPSHTMAVLRDGAPTLVELTA